MLDFNCKPTDRFIEDYYAVLGQYDHLHVEHETAVRSAFQSVLRGYSKRVDWTLVATELGAVVQRRPLLH